ncbi:MAG: hypothetical protein Unbinned3891contig1000_44 [Prokaryotic dsDNA virus sp.]|nr:MAG: hypothetical protein Unbinned3891contig1000_44 [Prokaryotic dsDNA virus sp.]|tara:strand:- start:69023 stop:69409 length:387 start_codon:yes stop_codon:yes gene_type:complete
MKAKSFIIYARKTPSKRKIKYTRLQSLHKGNYHSLYVRLEVVEKDDVHALDGASPYEGETVLNTLQFQDATEEEDTGIWYWIRTDLATGKRTILDQRVDEFRYPSFSSGWEMNGPYTREEADKRNKGT